MFIMNTYDNNIQNIESQPKINNKYIILFCLVTVSAQVGGVILLYFFLLSTPALYNGTSFRKTLQDTGFD